jgi:hypothetical protein
MARDLIPPSSPAGRPVPGAPHLIELPPEPPRSGSEPVQRRPTVPSGFKNRFGFLFGALAGVVVAAAVAVVLVVATGGPKSAADEGLAPNWSKWRPSTSDIQAGAAQIADHVGSEYTHPDGRQLVKVTAGGLGIDVALRPASGPISVINGHGILYQLNGLGPNGSIKGGKPSVARHRLVRREALELALYTFRYLPGVDMIVTLLPPPPPADDQKNAASSGVAGLTSTAANPDDQHAVFYRPGDLKPQLQVPLGVTMSAKAPQPAQLVGAEGRTVDALTLSNTFKWSLMHAQDSTPYLVLDRES